MVQVDRLAAVRLEKHRRIDAAQHTPKGAINHRPGFITKNELRAGIARLEQLDVPLCGQVADLTQNPLSKS